MYGDTPPRPHFEIGYLFLHKRGCNQRIHQTTPARRPPSGTRSVSIFLVVEAMEPPFGGCGTESQILWDTSSQSHATPARRRKTGLQRTRLIARARSIY